MNDKCFIFKAEYDTVNQSNKCQLNKNNLNNNQSNYIQASEYS